MKLLYLLRLLYLIFLYLHGMEKCVKRLAVFASGNGSNAENLVRYFRDNDCGMEVAVIVCNKAGAGVIERAGRLGVPVRVMPAAEIRDPECMLPVMDEYGVDGIVLAGFLLMVPDFLLGRYPDRVINIHPSLLPKYGGKGMYGRHVHEAVVAAGERETGITVHLVTDRCDEGRVLHQARVEVLPSDSPETVEAKVHALEKEHFARAVREYFRGDTKVS